MIPVSDVIPTRTWPLVTISLLAVNGLVFAGSRLADDPGLMFRWGLRPAEATGPAAAAAILIAMFVHVGPLHLGVNLLYLWLFGDNVEDRTGRARFFLLFVLSGLVAAVAQMALAPDSRWPITGAGGAVAGVLGAYVSLYPRSRVLMFFPFPPTLTEVPAVFFLGVFALLQFLSQVGALAPFGLDASGGFTLPAHVAAFVTGAVLCALFRRPVTWDDPRATGAERR